jgi:hypothetical protein
MMMAVIVAEPNFGPQQRRFRLVWHTCSMGEGEDNLETMWTGSSLSNDYRNKKHCSAEQHCSFVYQHFDRQHRYDLWIYFSTL